jgi:hypothetical protein
MVSYQGKRIPEGYLSKLPKGQCLAQLLQEVQQELGNKSIILCDLRKHPDLVKARGYGRYESDKGIVWIRLYLPSDVTEFVLAHELGHLSQEAKGYPRVSLKDMLRNNSQHYKLREMIVRIHRLAESITSLLQDPGADEFARAHDLLAKNALEYMRRRAQKEIDNDDCLPYFRAEQFEKGMEDVLDKVKHGGYLNSYHKMWGLLETVTHATVYATQLLRFSPYGLFDSLYAVYQRKRPKIQKLGENLANIAQSQELGTASASECEEVGEKLIAYLQIPNEVIGLKIADKWLS